MKLPLPFAVQLRTTLGFLAIVVLILACNRSEDRKSNANSPRNTPTPQIRDSAGIRIVEYPKLGPAPTIQQATPNNPFDPQVQDIAQIERDTVPFLVIGGQKEREVEELDPKNQSFTTVELSDGRIVIANGKRLMFYSKKGEFLRDAGRQGRGPGEFLQIGSVCLLRGDTVMVTDARDQRITLWDSNGEHIRTYARPGELVKDFCDVDGGVVVSDITKASAPVSANTVLPGDFDVRFNLLDPSDNLRRDLGVHRISTKGWSHPMTLFAMGEGEYHVGFGRRFEIRTYDMNARLKRITRLMHDRPIVTDAEWEQMIEESASRAPSASRAAEIRQGRQQIGKPYRFPAFMSLRTDREKRLWVSDWVSLGGWTIFDTSGVIVGRCDLGVGMPYGQLVGFGQDFIAVTAYDSDGAPLIKFYRLRKGAH